jgi:hypothetical protein
MPGLVPGMFVFGARVMAEPRFPGAVQHAISAFTRVFARYGVSGVMHCRPEIFTGSEQRTRRVRDDPGTAVHPYMPHRIREMLRS